MDGTLSVGILIVSTTAAQDPSKDASADILTRVFESANADKSDVAKWKIEVTDIVRDGATSDLQEIVKEWVETKNLHLIITTGGTGFATSDGTPEAIKPLLQKEAPGLVHAMLSASLSVTPFAMMSRPVAGIRNSTVIITLPGSPKGAKENLEAVLRLLPHACTQAAGLKSSRDIHSIGIAALERQHGFKADQHEQPRTVDTSQSSHEHVHSHGHIHGHHKVPRPRASEDARSNALWVSVTGRHRESPFPMISVSEANSRIAEEAVLNSVEERAVDERLVGYVLAEDVAAKESVPAYPASIVDGYAVCHTDGAGVYPVTTISHAAPGKHLSIKRGEVARVTTGAPVPDGASAVCMVEDTVLRAQTEDGSEEKEIEILTSDLEDGENIREPGSDVAAGVVVLRKFDIISSVGGEVGLLASVGISTVKVYRKPTVGILSTGDEIVQHNDATKLLPGQIRDSNRPALLTAVASLGFPVLDLGIVKDEAKELRTKLEDALAKVDVLVTTGGVSMGEMDLLKPTIEQELGGCIHFGRVAMKPGKPTTFATVRGSIGGQKKLIFSLPGNPASAIVTFYLFVLPSIKKSAGYLAPSLPRIRVIAGQDFTLDPRPEYHRVCVSATPEGKFVAKSTGIQRSSRIGSAANYSNAILMLPGCNEVGEKRTQKGVIPKGESVEALLWGQVVGL